MTVTGTLVSVSFPLGYLLCCVGMGDDANEGAEIEEPKFVAKRKKGSFVFVDGSKYEGEYTNKADGSRIRDGFGVYITGPERFEGTWVNDAMKQGKYLFAAGASYEGEFERDMFNGRGKYSFNDGAYYEGDWMDSKMHGEGKYIDNNGNKFEGQFFNGSFDSGTSYVSLRRPGM